jgi:hypothetical protein
MMPPEGQELREHMRQKYGTNRQQSNAARARLTGVGDSLGFSFDFYEGQRIYNTFLAHQLLLWAAQQGKQTELETALFESYFSKQENVGEPSVRCTRARSAHGATRPWARSIMVSLMSSPRYLESSGRSSSRRRAASRPVPQPSSMTEQAV